MLKLEFIDSMEYERLMRSNIAMWGTGALFATYSAFMKDMYWLLIISIVCVCLVVRNFCKFQSVLDVKKGKYSVSREGSEIVVKCKTYVWRFHREGSYVDDGVGVAFINNGYYTREVSDE